MKRYGAEMGEDEGDAAAESPNILDCNADCVR